MNFDYIKDIPYLNDLYSYCKIAEEFQICNAEFSALNARRALEWMVRSIYQIEQIDGADKLPLYELTTREQFRRFVNDERLMMAVHFVRKAGNNAAHLGEVTRSESFFCLLNLYNFIGFALVKLRAIESFPLFNKDLIPMVPEIMSAASKEPDFTQEKPLIDVPKPVEYAPTPEVTWNISEAETRKYFIDIMLKDADWDVLETEGAISPLKACIEVEVEGMPNTKGVGYADYVLFGADSKPLAVVEAKRTSVNPENGKHQAELYADCLEKKYGVRPVIYYTNGYHTYIIDGLGYPSRELLGFHTASDLQLLIQQRGRNDIKDFTVKDEITDRFYQKGAIKAVCEHFNNKFRRALLVMATGTGKTRVSISMVDVLMRNGWVKNVLFLADRITLVTQAHKNFTKLLPTATTCVLSETGNDKDKDLNARIMFSTYQTMINYIDTEQRTFR